MKVKEGERVFETMKRILDMAGKYRRYITSGIVISLFHSLCYGFVGNFVSFIPFK